MSLETIALNEAIIALEAELAGVHAGTHAIVPIKATPEMIAEGWKCLKRNHLPTLGPGKCLIEAWPAMIKTAQQQQETIGE